MATVKKRPVPDRAASFRSITEQSPAVEAAEIPSRQTNPTSRKRRKFILCFDGTGNKFHGTDADSNILKIYRMLDRNDPSQFHYYQPGIGTYVSTSSLSHTSTYQRIRSWYTKMKDSAVGTSFAEHVMGGYKFLMRYYHVGDDIYLFGFSRGAYTARFLAEMLDHVGLLSAGNEEMARFAWKTFQKWQIRQESTEKEREDKKYLLDFMCAFRETFSRPVRRIRFLGLFDTVNSVPKFETAFLQRSKFPYTARSTAKVIRHAVAIDERRAKFRSDLISEVKHYREQRHHSHYRQYLGLKEEEDEIQQDLDTLKGRDNRHAFRDASETSGIRGLSPSMPMSRTISVDRSSLASDRAINRHHHHDDGSDDEEEQDIKEVWFAGAHGDSGGGWQLPAEELPALSHIPLVWMVREAQRAGLRFDENKMRALNCIPDDAPTHLCPLTGRSLPRASIPHIEISSSSPRLPISNPMTSAAGDSTMTDTNGSATVNASDSDDPHPGECVNLFEKALKEAATKGKIHDCLSFNKGVGPLSVIAWNVMEYLPFRRMDLQSNGQWRSIVWPLPKGEVRDIPNDVVIHHTVLLRMRSDASYRPGNLIVGGGGRGMRKAPPEYGMGRWRVAREEGDVVGECWVRDTSGQIFGGGSEKVDEK
ncbi:hypothetical protein NA57DRAFT_38919 [Rhizodiscina lignyota]|uniref:T6SS Phospholipase effector Tle1-like catalytic domain-containing protein n=1 Tax=Rhizodiscina lignyota TaxID=1504668 RepID=A0A9P4ICI0_9PEZI|nr:hypothetical protein NA57DRAFT_38919 [Rhizodiscina lignyota]